jgi:hypothetical protein
MIPLLIALMVFLPFGYSATLYERLEQGGYLPGDHRQWKRWPSSMRRIG